MEPITGVGLAVLIWEMLVAFFGAFFLLLAARIAGLTKITFGRALLTSILMVLISVLVDGFIGAMLGAGILARLIAFIIQIWFLSAFLATTWMRAFFVTVVYYILAFAVLLVVSVIAGVGIVGMLIA